jgi:hypothetical protein
VHLEGKGAWSATTSLRSATSPDPMARSFFRMSRARWRAAPGSIPRTSAESSTFSRLVHQSNRTGLWNMIPMSRRGPTTGRPLKETSPALRSTRPPVILSSVDFPQPLGPTRVTNSPSSTEKVIPSSARMSRASVRYTFWTLDAVRIDTGQLPPRPRRASAGPGAWESWPSS